MDDSHSRASGLTLPPIAGSDFSAYQNNPSRSRQYSTEAWDAMKPLIKKFYIDDNNSLPQLMEMLSEEHDFHPTHKMFKRKFELWNFAKNITDKTARRLLDQKTVSDATGRLAILGHDGRPVDERRLRKYLRRKGLTPLNPMLSTQNLSTSSDSTSTTPTPRRELLDVSDMYPDPHDMLPGGGSYEQDCPYRPWAKKFRFSETYPDGTIYQRDSFGYDLYINADEERPCTSHCFCRRHHLQEAFTFEAHKSANQMHITIYSHSLYNELATHIPLDNVERGLGGPTRTVNGLALLRHYHTLMRRLKDLRSALCDNRANQSLALEMDLLVNGFLGHGQVFQSFGYENLYELGFMDYQLWKYFQKQKLDDDITKLDDGFCAIDDEEALSTSGSQFESTTTFAEEEMADKAGKMRTALEQISLKMADEAGKMRTALEQISLEMADEAGKMRTALEQISLEVELYTAVPAGDEEIVRLLLDRGADINGAVRTDSPLRQAAMAGHEGIVRLLLDRRADVNRTNLWGDSPLSQAAIAGHEGIVRLLLDHGADVNGAGRIDSPLCQAAIAGHEGIVRLLLDRGADINALCSALSMAAKHRRVDCVRRLIRAGANVQIAALYLQGEGGNHVQWLLKVAGASSGATNVGRKKIWLSADSDASENIRHVRLKFVGQYMLMRKSAQNSQTRLRDLPQQCRNYREAWTAGIETMRELSRGGKPPGVYETLAFLSLGRAIVETLRDRKNCDYLEGFEQDLGRWGQLFENAADLEAYEDALNLMWGVVYNEHTSRERGRIDEDTLIRFQELASTLVGRTNDLLGSEAFHDRRSDHYQQGRPKIGQIPVEDIPQRFSDHRSPGAKSPFQLEVPLLQNLNSSNIFDSMKTDTSSFEPVVLLLVAGAIFAVVIMFLEALRQTSNRFALHQIGTLQERYWILAAYLGLGNAGTQASFQIRQGEDLHAGYSFSIY